MVRRVPVLDDRARGHARAGRSAWWRSHRVSGGQVSLSPIPHIRREPIGMLGVPLLTAFTNGWAVGWASTPYDPVWAARYPRRAALMAAAGPTGNLLIAVLALVCLRAGLAAGVFVSPRQVSFHHLVEATNGAGR